MSVDILHTVEQHAFSFWLIIEGATEKVLQFIMERKSIYNNNLGFIEPKMYFWHYREAQTRKIRLIDTIFAMEIFFLMTFSELPSIGLC